MLRFHRFVLASTFVLAAGAAGSACASHDTPSESLGHSEQALAGDGVVISQVYPGGGNSGAVYSQDYVELFNRSSAAVSLDGLSLQYGAPTSDFGTSSGNIFVFPTTAVIPPGGYYLVALAAGTSCTPTTTPSCPSLTGTADATGTLAMGGTNGKVALARKTTALGCGATACSSADIVDLVAYGTGAPPEGSGAAPALTSSTADFRKGAGCTDTNDNAADFETGAPAPRNSMTAHHLCSVGSDAGPDVTLPDAVPDGLPDAVPDGVGPDTGGATDGGIILTDSGTDGAADSGAATDSGTATDTGAATDSGVALDTGVDTGIIPTDTGTAPTDTGTAPTDTGTAPTDTGVATDTGTAPTDTGVATDTGTAPTDTGTAPEDTGTEEDTGTVEDTGTTPVDTGTASQDTGPDLAPAEASEDSGCGCSVPGSESNTTTGASLAGLALGLAVLARRRKH